MWSQGRSEKDQPRFDAVICSSVLEYLNDLPASLRALVGMLKPHGLADRNRAERQPSAAARRGLAPRFDAKSAYASARPADAQS